MRKIPGILFSVLTALCALTAVIWFISGDGGLLSSEMLRCAPPQSTGLPSREYPAVGEMIAGYLTGREESFQHIFTDDAGIRRECFQPHEAAHMADCRELIRLDRLVMFVSGGMALILLGAGVLFGRRRADFCQGMLWGLRGIGLLAGALLIWAAVDFDGFFLTFHRIAFTNDGWLLDPRTDLLIRLMPEEFFISLGLRGLPWALSVPVLLAIAARIGITLEKKRRYHDVRGSFPPAGSEAADPGSCENSGAGDQL